MSGPGLMATSGGAAWLAWESLVPIDLMTASSQGLYQNTLSGITLLTGWRWC